MTRFMNTSTQYYQVNRKEVASLLPKAYSRVLEVGCGAGIFRKNMNQVQEYWGVEPVPAIAELAKENLTHVLVGNYKDVQSMIPNNYFDLIICNDVIEHMPDHDEFLDCIKDKLSKGGCLVASIPNVRYIDNLREVLFRKDWEYKNLGILDRTHLRFFTEKSLLRTLGNHAYVIEEFSGINPYRPRSPRDRISYWLTVMLLGRDIKYLQFCVRIKDAQAS
jgi:2-polyprenyl-3-methyl-5-hydroxy-6-metoxy-1,4-benzoquinol methylase